MFRSLSDLSELNPNFQCPNTMGPSDLASFIPMGDVSDSGHWMRKRTKPLKSVRQGFTPFANGDVLFAKITPCMENGKGAHVLDLTNGVGFGSTEFHVLRPKPEADARFIFHHTQHRALRSAAEAAMTGSAGQKRVPTEFFHKWKVYAPGKEEQSRIADILDTLDTQIQKTEALIAKLEKIKEGLLHDLLTQGIDQNGQLRPLPEHAPELYKESALGLIPKEWTVARIEEVSTKVTNGFVGVATPHYTQDSSGVLYLYGNNIRPNRVDLKKCARITQRFHSLQTKSQLEDGDMLTVQSGHIGTCAVYESSLGQANCHALIITRFKPDLLRSKFAALYCNSGIGMRAQARLFIGSTILHINTSDLAKLTIPVPPIHEQSEIINLLESTENRLSQETKNKDKLMLTKTGVMNDLLTGHVRVTPLVKDAV